MTSEHYPDPYIHTRSGRFYLDRPTFNVEDIAHALGMLCRFNGNTAHFYSVAQHSILVSDLMRRVTGGDPFEGLMHDAAEAFLSDIPTPFKRLLPDWQKFEARVEGPLRAWAGLQAEKSPACEQADKLALFIEANALIHDQGRDFLDPLGVRDRAIVLAQEGWSPVYMHPAVAKAEWLRAYYDFRPRA